ncbi:MAG: tripartite tricarboxylate transporter TctB family protein [Firmicutes bacterium]|nr:tripartite tricarboxylate transporter TctB family protein [Bacillota bacterium]
MRADRGLVALLAVVSILYTVQTLRIPNPPALADPLGPRAFPLLLGLSALALSVVLLLERQSELPVTVSASTLHGLGLIACGMAAYALLLPRLGFLISTSLVLTGGFGYAGGRRPLLPAVLFAVGVYLSFTRLLGVRLPPGILPWE